MLRTLAFAAAGLAITATLALAQGTGASKPHHGGQVVVVRTDHDHRFELVAKDGVIALYVRDEDDKPEPVKGAVATATVLAGGKQETIKLEPQEPNILMGKGAFVVAKGMRVVVSITMPEHKPVTARFTPAD